VGRHNSFGIVTRYAMDGPGIEYQLGGGEFFRTHSRPALGPTPPPTQFVPGHSRRLRRPRRGVNHPPSFSAEDNERVELYLYSLSVFMVS